MEQVVTRAIPATSRRAITIRPAARTRKTKTGNATVKSQNLREAAAGWPYAILVSTQTCLPKRPEEGAFSKFLILKTVWCMLFHRQLLGLHHACETSIPS
jgi:hypothetical protein